MKHLMMLSDLYGRIGQTLREHWGDNHDFRSPNQVELNPLLFPEVKPGSRVEYIAGEVFDTIR